MSISITGCTACSMNARHAMKGLRNISSLTTNPATSSASAATEKKAKGRHATAAIATRPPDPLTSAMKCFLLIAILLLPALSSAAEPLHPGKFSTGDLTGWSDKKFKGKTSYSLVQDGDKTVLKAHSVKAASGLIKKMTVDAKKFPMLRWSWKIDNLITKEDIKKKEGDDFPARIYVVFPRSFWRMRAITYAWASKAPKESTHPSPYTSNAMIIIVESGPEKVGQWVKEERNIFEDYRRIFGEDPPEIGAVALMTDTDDTQEEVTAYYGDIYLLEKEGREKPAPATVISR